MFTLDQVALWGRSFDEYQRMFALTADDFSLKILGCGDGPASFNAEATRRGAKVTSCDPIYRFDHDRLRERITSTRDMVLDQTRRNATEFVWSTFRSVEDLGQIRTGAMSEFLRDYPVGRAEGRYVAAELPSLPFSDLAFDLGLCSHFLFLYTTQLGEAFHHAAIRELCRVAFEVRVFPLLALGATRSPLFGPVVEALVADGWSVSIESVPYEFQRGGDEMMRVRRAANLAVDAVSCAPAARRSRRQ
jgi:hypothetical protein